MRIRHANQLDVPDITLLTHELGYRCKESDIRERLSRISRKKDRVVLVCVDDNRKVIGWIHGFIRTILQDQISVEIEGFVVSRRHRKNGVGSLLLEKMEEWAASHGISKISLGTNVKREPAHKFYYKRGFYKTKVHYRLEKYLSGAYRRAKLTGIKEKTALVKLELKALIAMESSKRLAKLGGTEKELKMIPRRRIVEK